MGRKSKEKGQRHQWRFSEESKERMAWVSRDMWGGLAKGVQERGSPELSSKPHLNIVLSL